MYDAGPQGLNRYSYALNNPIIYRDPSGHQVEHWYHPFTNAVRGAHETVNAGLAWVDEASGHNTVVVVVNNAVVKTVSDVGFGIVESGAGLIPLGEQIGEWGADPLDPNKIPVVGPIGKEVGESYADAYMDPNVETISRAVAATADAVGTAPSGVQTTRGLTKPSKSKTSKKSYSNKKNRPKYGSGQVDDVWENAKQADGNVYDPNTGELLEWDKTKSRQGQWDMGHKPGKEYRKLWQDYMDGKITKEEFLEEYRNADNYQPESPSANSSHRYEEQD